MPPKGGTCISSWIRKYFSVIATKFLCDFNMYTVPGSVMVSLEELAWASWLALVSYLS